MTRQWAQQEEAASRGRRELYQRFERLSEQFIEMRGRLDQAIKDISIMQPAVRLFEDGLQQVDGASRLVKVLWAAAVAIAGIVGWAVHELFGAHPPPH